jgi:hypothetical protein
MESSPKTETEKQPPPEPTVDTGQLQDNAQALGSPQQPAQAGTPTPETAADADKAEDKADEDVVIGAGFDFADPNSPLAPLYMHTRQVVAVSFLALLFLFFTYCSVAYTDIWGHLKFGQYIIEEGRLPTEEMFSGDFAEKTPYINYQWAAQAGEYLVFDFGRSLGGDDPDQQLYAGAALLSLSLAVVRTLQFLVLILAFRRLTGSLSFALVGACLALFLSVFASLQIVRPQMFGDLAFAVLLFLLSRPVLSRWALIGGPLLMVAWANFHGSFIIGLALIGVFWLGRALSLVWPFPQGDKAGPETSPAPPPSWQTRLRAWPWALVGDAQIRRLTLLLVVSLAGVMVLNPHGPALLVHVWKLSNHPNIIMMNEWLPLDLQSPGGVAFLASVVLAVGLLVWSPRQFTPTQLLLLVAFGVQTLLHLRVLNWWAMVFPWVVVPPLYALYRRYATAAGSSAEPARAPSAEGEEEPSETPPDLRKTILTTVIILVVLSWSQPGQWLLGSVLGREVPLGPERLDPRTPVVVAEYMKEHPPIAPIFTPGWKATTPMVVFMKEHPPIAPIFTSETLGDYLFWALPANPRRPTVFCYTHLHLFTTDHWQGCLKVKDGAAGWQKILDDHDIQYVAVERGRADYSDLIDRIEADKKHWEELERKQTSIFFARRIPDKGRSR